MPATTESVRATPDADSSQAASPGPSDAANVALTDKESSLKRGPERSNGVEAPAEFREGGHGWIIVVAVLLVNAHTWGMNSAYAVFLAYYLRSGTFPGASPLAFAFVGGLSISVALLISPLVTVAIRVLGTRPCLWIGIAFETAAFVGASFASQTWELLLSQGVAFGIGMGFLFSATVGIVPQWFTTRRSFANALAAGGSGLGGLTYSLGANAMIHNIGLAWAFRVLAILAFVVNGACALVIRDRNKAVGARHVAFHMALFRQPEFLLFIFWAFFALLGYVIVVFSLADYAQAVGLTASQGSVVAALFNLSQGLGRPLIGLISDRVGRINIAAISTLIACLSAFFLWIFAGRYYAGLIVYSLFGAFAGSLWAVAAPVGAEVIGLQLLPSALSITWIVLALPGTFSEAIGLALRKPGVSGYVDVQVFTACMYLVSFVLMWALRVWKIREIDAKELKNQHDEMEAASPAANGCDGVHGGGKPMVAREAFWSRSNLETLWVIRRV